MNIQVDEPVVTLARGFGIFPALAAGPMLVGAAGLAVIGWILTRGPLLTRLLGAGAGFFLAVATVAAVARPGLRAGADLSAFHRCVVTDPTIMTRDARLNLLLLIPFAVLATLALRRPLPVTAVALVASAAIEAVQATFGVGACDSSDLLHNTGGALAAALLTTVAWSLTRTPPATHPAM